MNWRVNIHRVKYNIKMPVTENVLTGLLQVID